MRIYVIIKGWLQVWHTTFQCLYGCKRIIPMFHLWCMSRQQAQWQSGSHNTWTRMAAWIILTFKNGMRYERNNWEVLWLICLWMLYKSFDNGRPFCFGCNLQGNNCLQQFKFVFIITHLGRGWLIIRWRFFMVWFTSRFYLTTTSTRTRALYQWLPPPPPQYAKRPGPGNFCCLLARSYMYHVLNLSPVSNFTNVFAPCLYRFKPW